MDATAQLLAAVEALMEEVKGLRRDLEGNRNATETLRGRRKKDADRQKRWRDSDRSVIVTSTRNATVTPTPPVVKALDLATKEQDQDKNLGRNVSVTLRPVVPKQTGALWRSYSTGYKARYGAEPVRNSKVNGQITQLLKRLPAEIAPEVAAFYLKHNGKKYVDSGHSIGLLLYDCEKLHTEWVTGNRITSTSANHADKTQENLDGWNRVGEELKRGLVRS